jgi:hypothetical protein
MKRRVRRERETPFTHAPATLRHVMKQRELDIDYLFLLEALERGDPLAGEQVDALVGMGLLENTPSGPALTMEARVKLANLRSLMRDHPISSD